MRKLGILFLMISMNTINGNAAETMPDSADIKLITQIAGEIRSQYAPDKRSALFELKFDQDQAHIETTSKEAKAAFEKALGTRSKQVKVNFNVLPDASVGENKKAVVRLSVVDIRYTPANQAEMVTQALLGTPVDLLKKQGDYYLIRTPEGYIAWLKGASLKAMNEEVFQQWQSSEKLMFTADYGHAFSEPSEQSQRVSDLVMGNILKLNGRQDGFFKVSFPDGRQAYIKDNQSIPYQQWLSNTELNAENVLRVAKTMIGVPYLWGGTSVKGVDCSGFTKTAYYMSGLVIPRDASQQVNSGKNIDILTNGEVDKAKVLANLKPADLLFFAERKGQVENARVTHVAIYLGNGEFIHASGLVRINSLFAEAENFDAHQARTIVSAKRYIGESETKGLDPLKKHPAYTSVN